MALQKGYIVDLASIIDNIVENTKFNGIELKRLKDMSTRADLIKKDIIDYRVYETKDKEILFGGLNFNSKKISTQTYVIKNQNGQNMGVITLILKPKDVVSKAKYVIRNDKEEKLYIGDFLSLGYASKLPGFIFTFGYIKVLPKYKSIAFKNTIKMVGVYSKIYEAIRQNCPKNTWIEVSAQGTLERKYRKKFMAQVDKTQVGEYIPYDQLEFDVHQYDFGKSREQSEITVWLAEKKLGLSRVNSNISTAPALGPIYVGKM
jgi:hypothetical protein